MSLVHLAVTFALVGLIWTIQLVHYPSFRYVPDFRGFHPHHTKSITAVVGPLMLAELCLATWLTWQSGWDWVQLVPLAIVLVIWGITIWLAMPLHQKLATRRDDELIEKLIMANWPRTVLWTVKGLWLLYFSAT